MHATKTEILARLKRTDNASVDELSSALGLAPMTVRQHLTALERDALVHAEEVRRPAGRPQFRYSLTDEGHRAVAEGYDRLVALLIEQAGALDPLELVGATPDGRRRGGIALAYAISVFQLSRIDWRDWLGGAWNDPQEGGGITLTVLM